jgi:hypothetical protein
MSDILGWTTVTSSASGDTPEITKLNLQELDSLFEKYKKADLEIKFLDKEITALIKERLLITSWLPNLEEHRFSPEFLKNINIERDKLLRIYDMKRIFQFFSDALEQAYNLCINHKLCVSLTKSVNGLWSVATVSDSIDALKLATHCPQSQLDLSHKEYSQIYDQIEKVRNIIKTIENEHNQILPKLPKYPSYLFLPHVLQKMNKQQAHVLKRYWYLCELNFYLKIDATAFKEFSSFVGLGIATHNYNKIAGFTNTAPAVHFSQSQRSSTSELCPSCGSPNNYGYCRCSR